MQDSPLRGSQTLILPALAGVYDSRYTFGGPNRGFEWTLGRGCLFIEDRSVDKSMFVVFDTAGGSVANMHGDDVSSTIPNSGGAVTPGTHVGVAPIGADAAALTLTAGTEPGSQIEIEPVGDASESCKLDVRPFIGHVVL